MTPATKVTGLHNIVIFDDGDKYTRTAGIVASLYEVRRAGLGIASPDEEIPNGFLLCFLGTTCPQGSWPSDICETDNSSKLLECSKGVLPRQSMADRWLTYGRRLTNRGAQGNTSNSKSGKIVIVDIYW